MRNRTNLPKLRNARIVVKAIGDMTKSFGIYVELNDGEPTLLMTTGSLQEAGFARAGIEVFIAKMLNAPISLQ